MFQWTKITPATASIPLPPRRRESTSDADATKRQQETRAKKENK